MGGEPGAVFVTDPRICGEDGLALDGGRIRDDLDREGFSVSVLGPGRACVWSTTDDPELIEMLQSIGYVGPLEGRPDVLFGAEKSNR